MLGLSCAHSRTSRRSSNRAPTGLPTCLRRFARRAKRSAARWRCSDSPAPLTLASYMIEGLGPRTFTELKSFLFGQPDAAQALFERLADAVTELLLAQLGAGAGAVQLFDTLGRGERCGL